VLGELAAARFVCGLFGGTHRFGFDGATVCVGLALPAVGFGCGLLALIVKGVGGHRHATGAEPDAGAQIDHVAGLGEMLMVGAPPPADVDRPPGAHGRGWDRGTAFVVACLHRGVDVDFGDQVVDALPVFDGLDVRQPGGGARLVQEHAPLTGRQTVKVIDELAGRLGLTVDERRDHDLPHNAGIVLSQLPAMRGGVDQRFITEPVRDLDLPGHDLPSWSVSSACRRMCLISPPWDRSWACACSRRDLARSSGRRSENGRASVLVSRMGTR
jgi:hypothetical protein